MVRRKFIDRLWKEYFYEDSGRLFFFVLINLLVILPLIGCPVWILVTDSVAENAIPAMFLLFGGILIIWIVYLGLSVFFTLHKTQYLLMYEFFRED